MNSARVLTAAAVMLLLGGAALAQEHRSRDGYRDGTRSSADRHSRGDWNHEGRGQWRPGDRPYYSSGWRGYRGSHYYYPYSRSPYWYSSPSWFYGAPYPMYLSYPAWEPPVVVERIIEREPVHVMRPAEPNYAQRSYAQVAPSPRAEPAPPPRLERYTLSATELFEFDKATLRMPQPRLDEIAEVMARNTQIDKVTISGFTDRLGTDAYNLKLSQRRAEAVKAYLVKKGVAGSRLVAVGKGEANPVVQCSEKNQAALIKCLEPNRRVEVEQITIERPRGK